MLVEMDALRQKGEYRSLPVIAHCDKRVEVKDRSMLNLSSNDYLGLASDDNLRQEFMRTLSSQSEDFLFSSSSSRLLTGNFTVYAEVEKFLASLFEAESALVFNSGYHANIGILPAVANAQTLILADKLVHASLIDGIRLSKAKCIRYRHLDYEQLERLLSIHHQNYERIILVTESIFSMDGDIANLRRMVEMKRQYSNVMLYVDEAHAIGVRGKTGLGCAEEQECISHIDFLVGTFGKALASVGAYVVCSNTIRDYLVNRMRSFIFTTALPPINFSWTLFVLRKLKDFEDRRAHLRCLSALLKSNLETMGYPCVSDSHILPMLIGDSRETVLWAEKLQRKGFYALPVRPPTVPEGTSRIRFSLTSALTMDEVNAIFQPNETQR
ncbi:MAG: 8-amino-7-oxononanoate synthase [Bacteroidaceae bacterium]